VGSAANSVFCILACNHCWAHLKDGASGQWHHQPAKRITGDQEQWWLLHNQSSTELEISHTYGAKLSKLKSI
jgi:hypothetical protein